MGGGVGAQYPWASDYDLTAYPGKIYKNGIERAQQIINEATASNPIYYIELAQMCNLGIILSSNPAIKRKMRLIQMAGSIFRGYGTDYAQKEYNVNSNGSAARIVYNHTDSIPFAHNICAAPLDTTYFFQIYGSNYQRLLNSEQVIVETMLTNYNVWYKNGGNEFRAYRDFNPSTATSTMYNVMAVWMASIIAERSANGENAECDTMPFMKMDAARIIVNDSQYTVVDTYNDDNIQNVYESIAWNDGDENGSYPLGEYIVDILTNPR